MHSVRLLIQNEIRYDFYLLLTRLSLALLKRSLPVKKNSACTDHFCDKKCISHLYFAPSIFCSSDSNQIRMGDNICL